MIKLNDVKELIKELGIADNEDNVKWAYKMLLTKWKVQSKIDYQEQMLAIENEYLDCCDDDCDCSDGTCSTNCKCDDDCDCGSNCNCREKDEKCSSGCGC